jgi:nucleoside-diphosphate-sugar epimerase
MKILVTGSSGFIGSHLTTLLARQGHELTGLDLVQPAGDYGVQRFMQGDVREIEDVRSALEGVDAVIHLAATHFDFGHSPEEYFENNETGMRVLLEGMREANVNALVFTSTIAVYGDRFEYSSEQTPPAPTSPYGESKLAAEKLIRQWQEEQPDRKAMVLRPCAVFGERNVTNMNNLIKQIDSGFFFLFGDGENIKAIAYVGNLIEAIRLLLDRAEGGFHVFNYSDQPELTVNQIVEIIYDALGKKGSPLHMPLWLGVAMAKPFDLFTAVTGKNVPVNTARVKKLAIPTLIDSTNIRQFGLEQPHSSEEGLRRMVAHHLEKKQSA